MSEQVARDALARDYAGALRDYVSGAGESALVRAYELGRAAASSGIGVLDLAMLHHEALLELPATGAAGVPALAMAAQFLAETLSPFEMTLRSYQANARLLGLSESLAQQNAETNRAREQLKTILDATTAVIYLKDADGRFQFVNRQFEGVFGLARDAVIGKRDDEVLPPEVARPLRADDLRALEGRAPLEIEETIPSADGPHTYIAIKFPLVDGSGAANGLCCVATDITERKRAEEALLRATEAAERERQLKRAVRARDEFLAIASHELKTPLTSLELQVASFRRLVRSNPGAAVADEKIRSKWDVISRQVDRLTVLVNTLLDVARITSGRLVLKPEPVDLGELVRGVLERMQDGIRWSRSEVVLTAPSAVVGSWDRAFVETVVANLLSNALKFGEEKPVEIAVGASGERATLTVRDHGIGISAEDQARIFSRFERAVSERHFGGFGIGLWVAHEAVRAHGGAIRVVSEQGSGSTFTVELPLARGRAAG